MTDSRHVRADFKSEIPASSPDAEGIVYGPVMVQPYGNSLGINLLGTKSKICSFNCVYCELGKTELRLNQIKRSPDLPSLPLVEQAIQETFKHIHSSGPSIDSIVLSGNGEPTLHPDFPEIAKTLITARNLWLPGKPIVLYSNGVALDQRRIADGANLFDDRLVKLDAGSDSVFEEVNEPLSRTNIARIIAGIRKLSSVTIQSLFFGGKTTNTKASDVDDWLEVVAMVKPSGVQIHGMSRASTVPGLTQCEQDVLYAIAARLERKTGIKALVFP